MSANLIRVNIQLLNPHERRREHGHRRMVVDGDMLRSMGFWRSVRRTGQKAAAQYLAHRELVKRRTLGQLRMVEAAIRCDIAAREELTEWRNA